MDLFTYTLKQYTIVKLLHNIPINIIYVQHMVLQYVNYIMVSQYLLDLLF